MYEGWERAHEIPMWPDGPTFARKDRPIVSLDEELLSLRAMDQDSFDTEFGVQFAAAQNAYLRPSAVARVFGPYRGELLQQRHGGALGTAYAAHGDPSRVGANLGSLSPTWSLISIGFRTSFFDVLRVAPKGLS